MFNSPPGSGGSTPGGDEKVPPDDSGIRRKFWVTFAAISVGTYVAAGLMMLGTASDKWRPDNWMAIVKKGKAEAALIKGKMLNKIGDRYERSWKKFWRKKVKDEATSAETGGTAV